MIIFIIEFFQQLLSLLAARVQHLRPWALDANRNHGNTDNQRWAAVEFDVDVPIHGLLHVCESIGLYRWCLVLLSHRNDVGSAPQSAASGNWIHVTWRYRADVGEQAIFINGQLSVSQVAHGPFQGKQ